jgi:hypothetical protein
VVTRQYKDFTGHETTSTSLSLDGKRFSNGLPIYPGEVVRKERLNGDKIIKISCSDNSRQNELA